jgi:hypothetical protein
MNLLQMIEEAVQVSLFSDRVEQWIVTHASGIDQSVTYYR